MSIVPIISAKVSPTECNDKEGPKRGHLYKYFVHIYSELLLTRMLCARACNEF